MKFLKGILPAVIVALLIAGGANAALWQWAKTAATNATADPSINWSEGQSPSSVNDSARAMMARTAEWRDDLSGLTATGGTSTAYTITTNQGFNSVPNDGQAVAFTVHADNGVAPTLRADGGTIYPIQSAAGTAIGAGVLVGGAPYTVKFKLASSAWVLHGFYGQPFVIPLGAMIDYTGDTSPNSNLVLPFGQCISRATYATYFALVSTRFGGCDGTTTFAVPDFRGTIAVGRDNMGGVSRSLITIANSGCDGSTVGTQCGAATIGLTQTNLPNVAFSTSVSGTPTGTVAGTPTGTVTGTPTGTVSGFTPSGGVNVSTPTGSVSISDARSWSATFFRQASAAGSGGAIAFFNEEAPANTSVVVSPSGGISATFTGNAQVATFTGNGITPTFTGTGLGATFTGSGIGATFTGAALTSTGVAQSGGIGTPIQKLPPIQVVNKLLRIF